MQSSKQKIQLMQKKGQTSSMNSETTSHPSKSTLAQPEATAWFDDLYAQARRGERNVPWAELAPRPAFAKWLRREQPRGQGRPAVVVGCGLGDDAEALAAHGFDVTAFDVSPTAVAWCRERFPQSSVDYQVADLFALPDEWRGAFDFVLESLTVQALPIELRSEAVAGVASLVAPGGALLVICLGTNLDAGEADGRSGPPWPLTREELDRFQQHALREQRVEQLAYGDGPSGEGTLHRWRVEYIKQAS